MTPTDRICERARELGFDLAGVASVHPVPHTHIDAYRAWLALGYQGEMGYMARPDRVERREDPARILPGARSIVCVGLNYYPGELPADITDAPARGLVSNYAWGLDYHDLMLARLKELAAFASHELSGEVGTHVKSRAYVDTGPILERAYAARAGLGFIGKNTCLIHPQMGSWLFLGELLLDVELEPTPGEIKASCGTCRRCLDSCPTGALVAPYVLDARRCISYLTIELKGPIPRQMRPLMGNWIYGCDVCQAVCPWQRFARPTSERSFHTTEPGRAAPALLALIEMDDHTFRRQYQGTALSRIGRQRLLRNVAVALGNQGDERAVPTLVRTLAAGMETHPGKTPPESVIHPLARGHAAWALGHIGGQVARKALTNALRDERDPYVRHEIEMALERWGPTPPPKPSTHS